MSEPGRETPTEKLRIAFALIDVAERDLGRREREAEHGADHRRGVLREPCRGGHTQQERHRGHHGRFPGSSFPTI